MGRIKDYITSPKILVDLGVIAAGAINGYATAQGYQVRSEILNGLPLAARVGMGIYSTVKDDRLSHEPLRLRVAGGIVLGSGLSLLESLTGFLLGYTAGRI